MSPVHAILAHLDDHGLATRGELGALMPETTSRRRRRTIHRLLIVLQAQDLIAKRLDGYAITREGVETLDRMDARRDRTFARAAA